MSAQKLAAGFLGSGLAHLQMCQPGYCCLAVIFVCQGGQDRLLRKNLFLQIDLFAQDPGFGHDPKANSATGIDKGVFRAIGQGLAFAREALQLPLQARFLDLAFGKARERGYVRDPFKGKVPLGN